MAQTNWQKEIKRLIRKYKGQKHPLDYKNLYQLVVMVILSARDSDKHINKIAPGFFKKFPDMKSLARADESSIVKELRRVRNFYNKAKWLMKTSSATKNNKNIPTTMEGLTALAGIGRKSANVIMREAGVNAEGVMVDLHVVRVAQRLGITPHKKPDKIEKDIMKEISEKDW